MATRKASGATLAVLADLVPNLWGGSADLAGSNNTPIKGEASCQRGEPGGRNLSFGIREHGMGGIMNGIALHGGLIPYGGTFLTFSDYMRGSIRLAALMQQRVIYVFTHDSIFLGEDGPTHQAVEHAMALRLIPNLDVLRPADARETAAAWAVALRNNTGPSALLLTRQGLAPLEGTQSAAQGVAAGAYVLSCDGDPEMIVMGSGSEVQLVVDAADVLRAEGRRVRVVSVPSMDRFLASDRAAQDEVLPPSIKRRLAVEAGRTFGWREMVGDAGAVIGIDRFGESAPASELATYFGFTAAHVTKVARELL
jgi:transketolase